MHWNEWLRACREFHDRYDGLAFPGGYSDAFERIHSGDPDAIEAAICFLEIRPYFFRSGYMFKDLLRKVRHAQLSSSQAARFQSIQAAVTAWKAKKAAALRKTAP